MKGLIIKTDDTVDVFEFDPEDSGSTLAKFQEIVGGYIVAVPQNFNSKISMYANELPMGGFNTLATFLSGLFPQDSIHGNVIVVGAADEEGYETGLTDMLIDAVKAIDVKATWDNYLAQLKQRERVK